jgi:hypothetical protein
VRSPASVASIGLIKRPAGAEQDWVRPALHRGPVARAVRLFAGCGHWLRGSFYRSALNHGPWEFYSSTAVMIIWLPVSVLYVDVKYSMFDTLRRCFGHSSV